uniref:NADH dehydrogenase subunit 4L n=1 Tax=Euhemisphaerius bistriatus TaxID=3081096 RepID=UPI002E77E90E|nr:NADH dehydrogenase subunit 4L [Epyhemisphaerius bistriatus]WQB38526.1 NADH dehydrogenase subunit 4L [Epyhemisphaerius bistriatus]
MVISFFIYISGLFGLIFVRKHFLMSLLMLEFLVLSLFFYIFFFFGFFCNDYYFVFIFLILGVCEGVIGLSLIVNLSRSSSTDYLSLFCLC